MKDFLIRLGGAHHQPTSPPARSRGNDGGQHADTTDGVHVQQGEHEASPRGVAGPRPPCEARAARPFWLCPFCQEPFPLCPFTLSLPPCLLLFSR